MISRPQTKELPDFRGYMGRLVSGRIAVGDTIQVLPSGLTSTVQSIVSFDGEFDSVEAPRSATLTLEDDIDISRGI